MPFAPIPNPLDLDQLRSEIAAVGLDVQVRIVGDELEYTYPTDGRFDDLRQIVRDHRPSELDQFDALVEKARRVWRGEDTFTQAQAQKILAGLVLLENRRR